MTIEFETLWTAVDVARYLKCSRSLIYQKAEAGMIPYLRVGGLLRFDPHVVQRWVRGESAGAQIVAIR